MPMKIQYIIGLCLIVGLVIIINMIRKRSLELKYALSWILAIVFVLILVLFPTLQVLLSNLLGIATPVNMIFFLGFCFSLLIIFTLTVIVSRTTDRLRKLAQQMAILEQKVRDLESLEKDQIPNQE